MSEQVADPGPSALDHLHLDWRVVVAVLLFFPFGIVAGWYSWRSQQAAVLGDEDGAATSQRLVKRWFIAALVVGIVIDVVLAAVLLLLGAFPTG